MDVSIEDLVAISIKEFENTQKIPFDLYVRLPNDKFLLVMRAGMLASTENLSEYAKEHLTELYVKKVDYRKYVSKNVLSANTLLTTHKDLQPTGKASILSHATNVVFSEIERLGFSNESFLHAKNITGSIVKIVDQKPELSQIMSGLMSSADRLVDHCVAVSAISAMVGRELNWQKDSTIEKIALGGMLHDIGKKELPRDLLNKPRINYTHDEVAEYETHSYRGVQILQSISNIPDDVISIVYEHHENSFGQGFPRKLREVRMNPLARVVALANAFVNLTLPNINLAKPKSPMEAINFIENVQGRPYQKEAFYALKSLVERDKLTKKTAS